jgi:hypothetical protein
MAKTPPPTRHRKRPAPTPLRAGILNSSLPRSAPFITQRADTRRPSATCS